MNHASLLPSTRKNRLELSIKEINRYKKYGYLVLKCPYPKSLVKRAQDAVEATLQPISKKIKDTKGNHFRLQPQMHDSYWCTLDHSLPFLRMELHDEIVELAKQMEGHTDIYFRNGGINELAPRRSFLWHRDSGEEYVEFMHYFSGSNKKNGCLRVIPGSHGEDVDKLSCLVQDLRRVEWGASDPDPHRADVELPGEVSIALKPDELLVRSSKIFHSTWLNQSNSGRLMHHWLFRPSHIHDHRFNFSNCLTKELINKLTSNQRQILWLNGKFNLSRKWLVEHEWEGDKIKWGIA